MAVAAETKETIVTTTHNNSSQVLANPQGSQVHPNKDNKQMLPLIRMPFMAVTTTTFRCGIPP